MKWSRAHWLVGLLTLLLFPLAGVYMRYVAMVPQLDGVTRMMFRSRFLLLLMAAVANLALSSSQPKSLIQRVASAVILASPFPLIAAFFIDPGRGLQGSLWSGVTMRALFAAGALLAIANRPRR
jgi:hypothetical protein